MTPTTSTCIPQNLSDCSFCCVLSEKKERIGVQGQKFTLKYSWQKLHIFLLLRPLCCILQQLIQPGYSCLLLLKKRTKLDGQLVVSSLPFSPPTQLVKIKTLMMLPEGRNVTTLIGASQEGNYGTFRNINKSVLWMWLRDFWSLPDPCSGTNESGLFSLGW